MRHRGDVSRVDEAGIGLSEGDLSRHALDVVLVGDDVVERLREAERLEHRARVVADGDALGGHDQSRAGLEEVLDALDRARIRLRHHQHEAVGREGRGLVDETILVELLRVPRAGGGVDVRRRALADLRRQLVGARRS